MNPDRKLSFRAKIAAPIVLGGAALASACSSEGEADIKDTSSQITDSPVATRTIEATPVPTVAPTLEPTPKPTAEPIIDIVQVKNEVFADYSRGLAESGLNSSNFPDQVATNLEEIRTFLANCNFDKRPFHPSGAPDGYVFDPNDPDPQKAREYGNIVNVQCSKVADFANMLYEKSGNPNFIVARDKFKPVHKMIYETLGEDPKYHDYLTPQAWQSIERTYYTPLRASAQ